MNDADRTAAELRGLFGLARRLCLDEATAREIY